MANPYRAMCAELLVLAEESISYRAQVSEAVNLIDRARALLAQPEPPVAGEVAAALIELRSTAMALDQLKMYVAAQRVKRAADLLQHQHPQPVAVSERLPGPEDCDEQGRCWWFTPGDDEKCDEWCLDARPAAYAIPFYGYTHWLPANALPTPEATND